MINRDDGELGFVSRMTQPARHDIRDHYIDIRIW